MSCVRRKISLRHHSTDKLATDEVPMYQCPQLKYISLTSDEPIFLLVKHFISSSHEPDTFVLYIQQDAVEEHQIYPYKFGNFSPLMLQPTNIKDEKEDQSTAGEMTFFEDARAAKNQISKFIEIIKLTNGKRVNFNGMLNYRKQKTYKIMKFTDYLRGEFAQQNFVNISHSVYFHVLELRCTDVECLMTLPISKGR